MPSRRFQWSNLERSLLDSLASDLNLKGEASEALEKEYGVKPTAEFIREAWPTLLSSWLADDVEARQHLSSTLRAKGLGNVEMESSMDYLRSCRNTLNLREACIQLFLAKGALKASDNSGITARSSRQESSRAASNDKDRAESSGVQGASKAVEDEPSSDDDATTDAELRLALALLTPDIEEGLVRLGFLNGDGEWIPEERSLSALKRAIEAAQQVSSEEASSAPSQVRKEEPSLVSAPAVVKPPDISTRRQSSPMPESEAGDPPAVRFRWNKHTGAFLTLAFLLAIALATGPGGFGFLFFVGGPVALFSFFKDLHAQQRQNQVIPRYRSLDSQLSGIRLNKEEPAKTLPSRASAGNPTASQPYTRPPEFDYSPRQGKTPNTEEWGKANIEIVLNYAYQACLYCLALRATQHQNGQASRSTEDEVIWGAVLLMAAEEDKEMAKCLRLTENHLRKMIFDKLIQDGSALRCANGELELAEGVPEAEDVSFAGTEYADIEIEGLKFPMMVDFSPDQIHRYASSQEKWIAEYPGAAENWPKLVIHSRLLKQNRVTASQYEAGPWLYTANQPQEKSSIDEPVSIPQPAPSRPQAQPPSKEDEMILGLWESLRPAEAVDLKFMVMDREGRFAGEFTADDQWGDRYFVLTEKRNGGWSMATNLTSIDPDNPKVSKSAKAGLAEYKQICADAVYRCEPQPERASGISEVTATQSSREPSPSTHGRLTGRELITRVKQLGDQPPTSLALACGYTKTEQGKEVGDPEAFYNALFDAHSSG